MKTIVFFVQVSCCLLLATLFGTAQRGHAQDTAVRILDIPDYDWFAGCFGTATGNLMGYWDRNGFPDFYTGPTGGGLAPLDSFGLNKNIRSMWASKAGLDGRPADKFGHIDDYWNYYYSDGSFSYEYTDPDPYMLAGRPEHTPDCIGDFIGLSQMKWANLGNECAGNIDAYSFVFWDTNGDRRLNYYQTNASTYVPDIQSGLLEWTRFRGYAAEVFTQLADFNPNVPAGRGFSFADLKAEIDAGYPVLLFLQPPEEFSRPLANPVPLSNGNPDIHGMLAYGYEDYPGIPLHSVFFRTSWGVGEYRRGWDAAPWAAGLPVRGLISYHPKPKVRNFIRDASDVTLSWDGPTSRLQIRDFSASTLVTNNVHFYEVQRSRTLAPGSWETVAGPTTNRTATFADSLKSSGFYRVKLTGP